MIVRTRFLAAFLTAALAATSAVSWVVPSAAQSAKRNEQGAKPSQAPRVDRTRNLEFRLAALKVARTRNLEFLFGALKVAPDDVTAKAIEERIWTVWSASRSDTANLLMTRVKTAVESKDLDLAVKLLDSIVKIKPDYVEGWNRRAAIFYM